MNGLSVIKQNLIYSNVSSSVDTMKLQRSESFLEPFVGAQPLQKCKPLLDKFSKSPDANFQTENRTARIKYKIRY